MELNEKQRELCKENTEDFSTLKALCINCTLKRSPEISHTDGLLKVSKSIMESNGVSVAIVLAVDFDIASNHKESSLWSLNCSF